MAHAVNPEKDYDLLQRRLDQHLTGAPDSPVFQQILRLLFSPEDAALARRLPLRMSPVDALAAKLGVPLTELNERLTGMAHRGLIIDVEVDGRRYASLAPVVIGFFEFTFMRTRDDAPMAELAHLFEEYMNGDDRFARSVFAGRAQLGRSLVHEAALPEGDHTEVLDWERASHVVQSARAVGVSLCACRHKAGHLGHACERPQRNCLSFDHAAEVLVHNGLAEPLSNAEGMRILEEARAAGLAQTGDNVQRHVSFICNCCGCCCGFFQAIRRFDMRGAVVTSNWIMSVDEERCRGCGRCEAACPVGAFRMSGEGDRKRAVLEENLCLGCGVCHSACKRGALRMRPRAQRVFTPETSLELSLVMAIERGKLSNLIFADPEKLSHRALGRIVGALERVSPLKLAVAVAPLRSFFLNTLAQAAKRKAGGLGKLIE